MSSYSYVGYAMGDLEEKRYFRFGNAMFGSDSLTPIRGVRILPRGAAFGRVRFADVAQLAEQLFCKQQVAGSSPIVGSPRILRGAGTRAVARVDNWA
jgi:hypothetical protein